MLSVFQLYRSNEVKRERWRGCFTIQCTHRAWLNIRLVSCTTFASLFAVSTAAAAAAAEEEEEEEEAVSIFTSPDAHKWASCMQSTARLFDYCTSIGNCIRVADALQRQPFCCSFAMFKYVWPLKASLSPCRSAYFHPTQSATLCTLCPICYSCTSCVPLPDSTVQNRTDVIYLLLLPTRVEFGFKEPADRQIQTTFFALSTLLFLFLFLSLSLSLARSCFTVLVSD